MISNIKFIANLFKGKLLEKDIPLFVFLTITNKCNATCSYCFGKYYERYNLEKDKELTTKQIFTLIDELKNAGTQRIGISGGEPLLREDIGEIIDYIKDKGISCAMNTNGLLINKKIKEIKRLDSVTISLDGDKDSHDVNRGAGTYEKVIEAIGVVKKYNIPLHISTVVTNNNINSIDYVVELAKKESFLLQISPLYSPFWGDSADKNLQRFDKQKFEEIINKVISYKRKGYPVFYSYRTYKNILIWPDFTKDRITGQEPDFDHARCYMGKYICTIDANGDVYPCAQLNGFEVKNCLKVGFKEAFQNISHHNCRACVWACYNEYNLLFALHPSVIINTIRNTLFH